MSKKKIDQIEKKTENTEEVEPAVKKMRIAIAILAVIALLMALIVVIPTSGELTARLNENDFNEDGSAIRVRGTIVNGTNKPTFNVQYEIVVTDMSGNVLGTKKATLLMMLPWGQRNFEKFIYFDEAVDTGNVEITVNGYVVGE